MLIGIEAAHANKRERTGVEEYCWQVIQELKKIIPATERVVLYTNKPLQGGLEIVPAHWEIKVLRWPFKKAWSQTRLAWELFWHRPDVFFAPGQLVPLYTPANTVTVVHDVAFRVFPTAYAFFGRWYLRFMQRLIGRFSKQIITPSAFTQKELVRLYPTLSNKTISVVPLGYDHHLYTPQNATDVSVLKKYGIEQPYIITVSRLEEKKNTKRLVEAFNQLRRGRSLQLVLVGTPRVGYSAIQAAIAASPFSEDIHELGFVPTDEVVQLVRQASVFAFPSLYEGFGIPVLEAMAAGTPVVASEAGALPEVGGKAVQYCNPLLTDAIAKGLAHFLDDASASAAAREQGLQQARQFSWSRTAEQTWKIILESAR